MIREPPQFGHFGNPQYQPPSGCRTTCIGRTWQPLRQDVRLNREEPQVRYFFQKTKHYQDSDELHRITFVFLGVCYSTTNDIHKLPPFEGVLLPLTSYAHRQLSTEIYRKSPQLMEDPWFPVAFPLNPKDHVRLFHCQLGFVRILRTSPHMSQAHMRSNFDTAWVIFCRFQQM